MMADQLDIVTAGLRRMNVAYDRRGRTFRELGELHGISQSRARELVMRGERDTRRAMAALRNFKRRECEKGETFEAVCHNVAMACEEMDRVGLRDIAIAVRGLNEKASRAIDRHKAQVAYDSAMRVKADYHALPPAERAAAKDRMGAEIDRLIAIFEEAGGQVYSGEGKFHFAMPA